MWLVLFLALGVVAAVIWNRVRPADQAVTPQPRRARDRGADTSMVYADPGGGAADCGDSGGGDGGGGGGDCG